MRAVENDFDDTRMTIPRARDATGQGVDGGAFVRVHAGRGRCRCVQARRVQTRAITVTTRASKACADAVHQGEDARKQVVSDAGDHGEDACKPGVCGVGCYLCCILLSIVGQWGVGVRRVPSFLGFAIHQED